MIKIMPKKLCDIFAAAILGYLAFFYITGCAATGVKPKNGQLHNFKSLGIKVTSPLPDSDFAVVQIEHSIKKELQRYKLLENITAGPASDSKVVDARLSVTITKLDYVRSRYSDMLKGAVGAKGGFAAKIDLFDARTGETIATWKVQGSMWGGPGSLFGSSFLKNKGQKIAKVCAKNLQKANRLYVKKPPSPFLPQTTESANHTLMKEFPSLPIPSVSEFGNYHALVIGIMDYKYLPDLSTVGNDTRAVAEILESEYGFHVKALWNPDRAKILMALNQYRRKLTERDNLLVYYAGHGWLDEAADEGYWFPADATRDTEVNWVSNSSITASIRAIRAKHVMIVADSCYSGKLLRGIKMKRRTPDYLHRLSTQKARIVLSSGGLGPSVCSGTDGDYSAFASLFIQALRENKGIIDGTELFSKIRKPFMAKTNQTPEYGDIRKAGHEGGDFIFVRPQGKDREKQNH
jgi:Caspase domain